jgi:hypothetical protein
MIMEFVLEFIFNSFWRFLGSVVLFLFFAWWSIVLVSAFRPIAISMNHIYNGVHPDDDIEGFAGDEEDGVS